MDFLRRSWAEIDLSALKHNFNIIKEKAAGAKIMAVVKANAYGHGVCLVAPALDSAGADAFAVSNLVEALKLRDLGIKKPVLILGYTPADAAQILADNNISQCVYSPEYAEMLSENARKCGKNIKIHIKIDTGMSRIGFNCRTENLPEIDLAVKAAQLPNFILEGIFTHFAAADRNDSTDDGFTDSQYERFLGAIKVFADNGLYPEMKHCSNSAALLKDKNKHLDFCRAGIILYGLTPDRDFDCFDGFIPVMTFKSVVTMVKEIKAGDTVSYGRTFKAEKNMKIATVAAGYADGYPRILSGKSYVLAGGKKAAVIGRICMDQMLIDVSDINTKIGDEVILFGKDLSVNELSKLAGTVNYETVCGVSSRVERIGKE